MNKKQIVLIVALVAVILYSTVHSSPGGRFGEETDTAETQQETYVSDPVLRLYVWENYWATDTEQAHREVELEVGVTHETGHLLWIHDIPQGYNKYQTVCNYNYDDTSVFSHMIDSANGYIAVTYDGRIWAQHSMKSLHSLNIVESLDDGNVYYRTPEFDDGSVVGTDHLILVARVLREEILSGEKHWEEDGFDYTVQYLSDVYDGIPQNLDNVKRSVGTVYVTIRAMSDVEPDLAVAEAIVQVRHYNSWQGADLLELLEAGVPMKETSNRQEITLIQYTQLEDLAEALS